MISNVSLLLVLSRLKKIRTKLIASVTVNLGEKGFEHSIDTEGDIFFFFSSEAIILLLTTFLFLCVCLDHVHVLDVLRFRHLFIYLFIQAPSALFMRLNNASSTMISLMNSNWKIFFYCF